MEPFRMHREPGKAARGVSRRSFIRQAAAGPGAVAPGSTAAESGQSPRQNISRDTARTSATPPPSSTPPTIRVSEELIVGSKAPVSEIQFPMTGAQVFARACKDEGVAALFCCPGNYGGIHAIANIGIPAFSGRHEGAMTHAADAFIRVSGDLAVVSGTEGPEFTDMICGIAYANAARTPLLVVARTMALFQEDNGNRQRGADRVQQQRLGDLDRSQGAASTAAAPVPRERSLHKVGEALGAHGDYVTTPGGSRPALERAWQVAVQESRSSVINCQGKKRVQVVRFAPAGDARPRLHVVLPRT
jgi:thiamine pyrophosphate-dependent acetolactate synthase large subunit-like protein